MLRTALYLALMTTALLAPPHLRAQVSGATTYGLGTKSCESWTADRKQNNVIATANEAWVLGFVSGVGFASLVELEKTDANAINLWISTYCQKNARRSISEAAGALAQELIPPPPRVR